MIRVDESFKLILIGVHRNQRTPLQEDAMYMLEKLAYKSVKTVLDLLGISVWPACSPQAPSFREAAPSLRLFCSHHRPHGLYCCRSSADRGIYHFRCGGDLLSISGAILSGDVSITWLVVGWIIRSRWGFRNVLRCSKAKIRSSQNYQGNIVCLHPFCRRKIYFWFFHVTSKSAIIDPVIISFPNQLSRKHEVS